MDLLFHDVQNHMVINDFAFYLGGRIFEHPPNLIQNPLWVMRHNKFKSRSDMGNGVVDIL